MSKRAESLAASQRENLKRRKHYVCWSIHSDSGSGDRGSGADDRQSKDASRAGAVYCCAGYRYRPGYGVTGSVDYISNGFGGTLGSVGITIILGAIISMAIEDTGAAKVIANFFIKLFRGKRMELAPALTAFIMSIPVFGDITMVLTAPHRLYALQA